MSIEAGKLRTRIVLEQESFASPNSEGERVRSWTTFTTVSAQIIPATGREVERFKSLLATISHKIVIRYYPGVTPKMRVTVPSFDWDSLSEEQWAVLFEENWAVLGDSVSRRFAINAVIDPDQRKRELNLFCTEVVDEP